MLLVYNSYFWKLYNFFELPLDELQKFVEDNQWKRSLALEPNQLKAPEDSDDKKVMGNLNLSPSKHLNNDQHQTTRPFVPGHRRAKSDG